MAIGAELHSHTGTYESNLTARVPHAVASSMVQHRLSEYQMDSLNNPALQSVNSEGTAGLRARRTLLPRPLAQIE
jgi:hypothetical protein